MGSLKPPDRAAAASKVEPGIGEESGMVKIHGTYEYDDDDLTPGKKKEGGLHQNLFDSDGKLRGSARFTPDSPNAKKRDRAADYSDPGYEEEYTRELTAAERRREIERNERAELAAQVIAQLLTIGVAKVKPHARRLWREKARPALQAKWDQRHRLRRANRQVPSAAPTVAEMRVLVTEEIEEATTDYRQNMSSNEARARLMMAMVLRALSDEQLSLVANADIVLDQGYDELERRIAELPTEQVTYMLETLVADPSSLENQLLDLEQLLGLPPSDGKTRQA
jgi:hypothetical protein